MLTDCPKTDFGDELHHSLYNPFLVYCRKLAPGTVSLIGDRAQDDDSKHDSHYNRLAPVLIVNVYFLFLSCLLTLPL